MDLGGLEKNVTFQLDFRHPELHKDSIGNSLLMKGGNLLKHQFNLSSENTKKQNILDFWSHVEG